MANRRIAVEELNKCSLKETSPKVKKIIQKVPKIVTNDYKTLSQKVLGAFVQIDNIQNERNIYQVDEDEIKYETEKEIGDLNSLKTQQLKNIQLPFEEKVRLELINLGFLNISKTKL